MSNILESVNAASELKMQMMRQTGDEFYFPDGSEDLELYKAVKLTKDIKSEMKNISSISRSEIKTLVNLFYAVQDFRKASREQIRAIEQGRTGSDKTSGNVAVLDWCLNNFVVIEKGIQDSLEMICRSSSVGEWLLSITGIGPVLAAGLLAYYDVRNAKYATNFISYGGLNDNNRPWLGKDGSAKLVNEVLDGSRKITDDHVVQIAAKSQWKYNYLLEKAYDQKKGKWSKDALIKVCSKVPFNRGLKTHLWKVGNSFQWVCNDPSSLYGRLFNERKVIETAKNDRGEFAEQAAHQLEIKHYDKTTVAYKAYIKGQLPAAHIEARAKRWAEKIFVSHLFEEMYRVEYDEVPPRFYALTHLGEEHNTDIPPEVPYHQVSSEIGKVTPRDQLMAELEVQREKNAVIKKEMRKKNKEKKEAEKAAAEVAKEAECESSLDKDIEEDEAYI